MSQSPDGSDGKEPTCNAGDPGTVSGSGRSPGKGNGSPLQYTYLENPTHRGALGDSPWDRKELDTTEGLTLLYLSKNLKF